MGDWRLEIGDEGLDVGGEGGGEAERLLGVRVAELDGGAVQGLALNERVGCFVFTPIQIGGVAHGVEAVADDGMAQGAEVDAQLVGAAGLGMETEQGKMRDA